MLPQRPGVLPQRPGVLPQRPGVLPQRPGVLPQRPGVLPHSGDVGRASFWGVAAASWMLPQPGAPDAGLILGCCRTRATLAGPHSGVLPHSGDVGRAPFWGVAAASWGVAALRMAGESSPAFSSGDLHHTNCPLSHLPPDTSSPRSGTARSASFTTRGSSKGKSQVAALAPPATLLRLAHVQPVHRPYERDKSGSAAKSPVDDDLPRAVIHRGHLSLSLEQVQQHTDCESRWRHCTSPAISSCLVDPSIPTSPHIMGKKTTIPPPVRASAFKRSESCVRTQQMYFQFCESRWCYCTSACERRPHSRGRLLRFCPTTTIVGTPQRCVDFPAAPYEHLHTSSDSPPSSVINLWGSRPAANFRRAS